MTEHVKTGGPAFPCECVNDGRETIEGFNHDSIPAGTTCQYRGMTMRDYFAAKAMSSLIPMTHDELQDLTCNYDASDTIKLVAEASYTMADAMLRAREVEK